MFSQMIETQSKDGQSARNPHHVAGVSPHQNAQQIHLQTAKPDALAYHLSADVSHRPGSLLKTAGTGQQA
jgi:hypothetical protein